MLSQVILWIGVFVVILRLHQKNASLKRDVDTLKRDREKVGGD